MPVFRIKGKEPKSEVIEFELTQDNRGNVSLWANDIELMYISAGNGEVVFKELTIEQRNRLEGIKLIGRVELGNEVTYTLASRCNNYLYVPKRGGKTFFKDKILWEFTT